MTRTLIFIAALGAFVYGAVIPLGRLYYYYVQKNPQMCGVPGDYRPCKITNGD
jgi:hypothetical protein